MSAPRRVAWVVYGALEQVSGGYIYDRLVVEQLRGLGDFFRGDWPGLGRAAAIVTGLTITTLGYLIGLATQPRISLNES